MNCNTPILFLVFNRPQYTIQVFEAIRAAKPKQLFIAADGPRANVTADIASCKAVKDIVANVDWDCEVKTLFRDKNLGCGLAPSSAITWFFEHVEQGIILEDDCLPSASFFPFCEEMLERYKNDLRIHSISGTNFFEKWGQNDNSYFFSKESGIWGWATWRRAWEQYDYNIKKWSDHDTVRLFKAQFENDDHRSVYVSALESVVTNKEITFWDYQLVFSRVINSQFGIIPRFNLISNIGFGNDATHTFDENASFSKITAYELTFPLVHPSTVMVDKEHDKKLDDDYYTKKKVKFTLFKKVATKCKTLFN